MMPPAIVLDPPEQCLLMREEIFGPVLPVIGYDTINDALTYMAQKPHPLALYIFAENAQEQVDILDRTTSGGVTINGTLLHIAQEGLPFGGVGPSGASSGDGPRSRLSAPLVPSVPRAPREPAQPVATAPRPQARRLRRVVESSMAHRNALAAPRIPHRAASRELRAASRARQAMRRSVLAST